MVFWVDVIFREDDEVMGWFVLMYCDMYLDKGFYLYRRGKFLRVEDFKVRLESYSFGFRGFFVGLSI